MALYFIFIKLLTIQKIICNCFNRCETCSSKGINISNQFCDICKNDTYLIENTQNCFYKYEQPNYYLDTSQKLKQCPSPCYECLDISENNCISCIRGYFYNKETNKCEQCPINEYIYILDGVENCQYKDENGNNIYCNLKFTECSGKSIFEEMECPREYPLLIDNLNSKECVLEYIDDKSNFQISNRIIKTQWMNNFIQIGEKGCSYASFTFNSKGDLIMETSIFDETSNENTKYFYGIQKNGRGLFFNSKTKNYYYQKTFKHEENITSSGDYYKLINIKIQNNNEKEYYLKCGSSNISNVEIIDLNNNSVSSIPHNTMFDTDWISDYFSTIELVSENGHNYLFTFIEDRNTFYYISKKMIKFFKEDLSQQESYEFVNIYSIELEELVPSKSITCIEIHIFNVIQCFYIAQFGYFTIDLFDENFNLINSFLIDNRPINYLSQNDLKNYYQCIHFKKGISILGYIIDSNEDLIYIQIKEIINLGGYKLEDYFALNKTIVINSEKKFKFNSNYYASNLLKMKDNQFCLITTGKSNLDLYIIIFSLYNFREIYMDIRYYHIPLKLYNHRISNYVSSFNYNGFIGLIMATRQLHDNNIYQYFSILNYINGTDSEIIILEPNTTLNLEEYINDGLIENNIFGVHLYGIKIVKLPKSSDTGIYYFSELKNNIISEKEILSPKDRIIFIYDYDKIKSEGKVYTIEMAGIIQDPEYSVLNKYSIYSETIGSQEYELFYKQNILIGKTCFYNFTISNNIKGINENNCSANCKICYNNNCIKCINDYAIVEGTNNCIIINLIFEGYYLDKESMTFKKCHESCKKCSNGPIYDNYTLEISDSNCDICIDNYYKIINTNNCIYKDNTPLGYYFDKSNDIFYDCYKNCKTCDQYKNNTINANCLSCDDTSIFYEYSHNCLSCVFRDQYINYYQYDCIDSIPDGYFLINNEIKTIDKCYITCKHCLEKGNDIDHKCTECSEAYPYNFNNGKKCLDDCSKENLFLDIEDKTCYKDCKDNINERKYNYKNKCIALNEEPKNYKLDNNNSFISLCNPKNEYEFNNECYKSCPNGTKLDNSVKTKNVCICNNLYYLKDEEIICVNSNICPKEFPFLELYSLECTKCPYIYKDNCISFCPIDTCVTQINKNLKTCVDKLENTKILGNTCFDDFPLILDNLNNLNSNEVITLNTSPGVILTIYKNGLDLNKNFNKYKNSTFIDLEKCSEQLIKNKYLNSSKELYIIIVDIKNKEISNLFNRIDFEFYLNKENQVKNFYDCQNYNISISTPIKNKNLINLYLAKNYYDKGYDIFNISSEFYNDICEPINTNDSDLILRDRIDFIYPTNISFCPYDCTLNYIDIQNERFNCSCSIFFTNYFDEMEGSGMGFHFDKEKFINSITLKYSNFDILKCYKVLFNKKIFNWNIGSYLLLLIILIYIIGVFLFYFKEYKIFFNIIQLLIKNILEDKNKIDNINNNKFLSIKKIKERNTTKKLDISITPKSKESNIDIIEKSSKKDLADMANFQVNNEKISSNNSNLLYIYTDYELNYMDYIDALKYDKRTYFQYYFSLIKINHILIFTFLSNDENSRIIKLCLFFFSFSLYIVSNALFFNDSTMHKYYEDKGEYDFIYELPKIIYSSLGSSLITYLFKYLSLVDKNILLIKREKTINFTDKIHKEIKCMKIKFILFFNFSFIFLIFFWYYISVFCTVYSKTQIILIKDTIISFCLSLLYPFLLNLLPGVFRLSSLRNSEKNKPCLYKISTLIQ